MVAIREVLHSLPIDQVIHGDALAELRKLAFDILVFAAATQATSRDIPFPYSICLHLKLFLAYRASSENTLTTVGSTTYSRTKEIARFRQIYAMRLFLTSLATMSASHYHPLVLFLCQIAGTRAKVRDTIPTQKRLTAMVTCFRISLDSFRLNTLTNVINSIIPSKGISARNRAAFIARPGNRFTANLARWLRNKFGGSARHGKFAMQGWVKDIIRNFNPVMLRASYMAIMTACYQVSKDVSSLKAQPEALRDEMVSNEVISSSAILTYLVTSKYSPRYFLPELPFIGPFTTAPCRIASARESNLIIFCHALFRTVYRDRAIFIGRSSECFTTFDAYTVILLMLHSLPLTATYVGAVGIVGPELFLAYRTSLDGVSLTCQSFTRETAKFTRGLALGDIKLVATMGTTFVYAFAWFRSHILTPLVSTLMLWLLPGRQGHASSGGLITPSLDNTSILSFFAGWLKAEMLSYQFPPDSLFAEGVSDE